VPQLVITGAAPTETIPLFRRQTAYSKLDAD
jgi:hypothetical protein